MVIMRSVRGHNSFQNPVNVNVALIQMAAVQFIAPLFWRIHSTFKLLKTLEVMSRLGLAGSRLGSGG
ncbi:hypothetical protein K443DRAFT_7897 [Laccaria amethystina LaAM-08-1]|uniref:Uncharacterized protein n=1 Tax=Laccaria amethystina LaAM-08-1 TaxID=1095629 RepID=A0A0C9X553_9AGAR|nr:hypothetical protein K443DRAFT_7897 [Laccaria amethystina LaAM-08-1]